MQKPRLIYYNDGHHFHAKRIEPPSSVHMLQWPVDEVAGTGVDLLVLGLGYGDVYFHASKVGRVVGQDKRVWESYIDWRIMRMVEEGERLGTDQVRQVIKRGRELGLNVFPSLRLQDVSRPGDERCGRLKGERGAEVCLGVEGRNQWAYDFALESVQDDKLAVLTEILDEYAADGIELDFMFGDAYFKPDEADALELMSGYMARIRQTARAIGARQGRDIPIMARVCLERRDNLAMGLDVEAWLSAGSVDFVVGQDARVLGDTQPKPHWLADAANAAGGAAYYRPPRRVYDERVGVPGIEMSRALGQTLKQSGYAGLYHGYMRWPFGDEEYRFLREAAFPETTQRKTKLFYLQPREGVAEESTTTPERLLPVELEEGQTARVGIWVADDVDEARADGELRKPVLTLRFSFFCIEDTVEFRFNGRALPWTEAEITDERALTMATRLAVGMEIQAPLAMAAHWFRYRLEPDQVKRGENLLEVECRKKDKRAGFVRSLNGVEILMRYRDMERPEGFGTGRVVPAPG